MWTSNEMIAVYILIGVVVFGVVSWVFLRKTIRTRLRVVKSLKEDPDINDYLVIFDWTPKILYIPSIAVSFLAALIMLFAEHVPGFGFVNAELIGGVWFGVVFANLIIEEYNISIKLLLIGIVSFWALLLWLHLLSWAGGFLGLFRNIAFEISSTGYILLGLAGLLTILVSWLRGLFFYIAITPNYMNLQEGPTETGQQLSREDYNTVIDTSDFLERLMGFGKIVIIFKDMKRTPLVFLVWGIQKKAQMLERVRGKFAIDFNTQTANSIAPQKQVEQEPVDAEDVLSDLEEPNDEIKKDDTSEGDQSNG